MMDFLILIGMAVLLGIVVPIIGKIAFSLHSRIHWQVKREIHVADVSVKTQTAISVFDIDSFNTKRGGSGK